MKSILKYLIGTDRGKIIAVLAVTREEAAACVEHARTAVMSLPIRVWCAEPGEALVPCDQYVAGATRAQVRTDLGRVWPALVIVAWSGMGTGTGLKLLPFVTFPFRFVVRNEAGGFFPGQPGPVWSHCSRRLKDGAEAVAIRLAEWTHSAAYRIGERIRDVFRLGWSLIGRLADWVWSLLLALLALLAPLVWPLARAAMTRNTAMRRARVEAPPADVSTVEIPVADRRWRRARIGVALTSSSASWVVFRHPSCKASADELLEVGHATGAFAVARQAAYTGWRRRITTRHPFRVLEPGEMSQVFSPASPLLVVRADVLRRLGLPRAFTFGAAMELLYWQAASEGLESFVVGTGENLSQEPAMALEDVEFVVRREPWRPRMADLRRGNVATAVRAPGFRGKPRILVVSPYLPFPFSHGGAVRIYNLCRELSGDIDFILACFREAKETVHYEELHKVFREVYVVDTDEKAVDPSVPQQVYEYRNSAMSALLARLCRERSVDLVQLEYTQMAEYRACAGALPVLLVEHDITFSLHRQLAESTGRETAKEQFRLWQSFERKALSEVRQVWTMSEQDRQLALQAGAPAAATSVVPNGVDLLRYQPSEKPDSPPTVLFVGSFRHLPNLLAFEALRDTILPQVRSVVPDVRLHVVAGPDHERVARLAGKAYLLASAPGISIQGFVSDLRPVYRDCDVVVIPLPVSAGTNIKLMEAMACGRAVVSTPVGCTGLDLIDGEDLLIRDPGPGFAAAITDLLLDGVRRQKMAQNARQTAENRFGWHAIAAGALADYRQILRRELR